MYNGMQTVLIGNITDPELRYTSSGVAVISFSVAVNKRTLNSETKKWEDGEPTWVRVQAWRDLAENCAETLKKGTRVICSGTLENRAWEDKQGETRYTLEMNADAVGVDLTWAKAEVTKVSARPQESQTSSRKSSARR